MRTSLVGKFSLRTSATAGAGAACTGGCAAGFGHGIPAAEGMPEGGDSLFFSFSAYGAASRAFSFSSTGRLACYGPGTE